MVLEMKIKKALDGYTKDMKELNDEYNRKFRYLSVDRFGMASASELLELNEWHRSEKQRITTEFVKAVKDVENGVEH